MNKTIVSPYFVLYLVALVGLLLVINERDAAEKGTSQIIDTLLTRYFDKPILSVQDTTRLPLKGSQPMLLAVSGLNSESEKASVKFVVNSVDSVPTWDSIGRDLEGNGLFFIRNSKKAEFIFEAYCEVVRDIPQNLSDALRKQLTKSLKQKALK